ncbi:MAG: MazG family protein [Clostridiales bacterium]|jgi:MazG family protein|nr:MazG family protein [Clostridiales bacterium]
MLKIIGLGRFDGDVSARGLNEIKKADCVILKSEKFKSAASIAKKRGAEFITLDGIFESAKNFDELNLLSAEFVLETATRRDNKSTVFLVNGSGADDAAAAALIGMGAELIPAASAAAYAAFSAVKNDAEKEFCDNDSPSAFGTNGVKNESGDYGGAIQSAENDNVKSGAEKEIYTAYFRDKNVYKTPSITEIGAYELRDTECFFHDKRICLAVRDIDDIFIASDVKLRLFETYGDAEVLLLYGDGKLIKTTLFGLDEQKKDIFDYRTVAVFPPSDFLSNKAHDLSDLYLIMKRLRGKNGCEWDRAQTHKSIAVNAVEEAYELQDAIDADNADMMLEESGDVLLQALFHAVIAEDERDFSVYDMLTALGKKLISRHTHIFGAEKASNVAEALTAWEKAKENEKKHKNMTDKIESVPKNFPALMRAVKIMRAAAKYGFETDGREEAFKRLIKECERLKTLSAAGMDAGVTAENAGQKDLSVADADGAHKIGGDALLAAVNYLRLLNVEPETALKDAVNRAVRRLENAEAVSKEKSGGEMNKNN